MATAEGSSPLRVLIIGAGSAGLLLAQAFKKVGINAAVFEKDASPTARPRDWNFGIYWAQSPLEDILPPKLHAQLETVQTDASYKPNAKSVMPIINGVSGELLRALDTPLRPAAEATGIDVRFGKALVSIQVKEDGLVESIFADGNTEVGNLVIGAEGAHSVVRDFLFESSPEDAKLLSCPIVVSSCLAKLDPQVALDIRKINPTYYMTLDPTGLMSWASVHDCASPDPAEWTFCVLLTWNSAEETGLKTDQEILDDMRARVQHLAYPFKESVTTIPSGTRCWHARLTYLPTKPWDSRGGLVTLAGDAAHSMTFHRGQGLGNAITDVAELLKRLQEMKSLTPAELAKAVQEYEKEVWPRGHEAVMANLENTIALHNWDMMMQSAAIVSGVKREGDKLPSS
ncbi:hypothetical protein B0T16DRAFT_456598 [Cercophora newfieldiana]|uniref:FAD-binding domain-containing protein n=1 Tax=Cercophora newfieldiana TaxID=92897 RepID=A0AA40CRX6_9PEZI|nr:hypothetical protein B0T16DRAFT_456598 [Cercophora newfieldiana]